METKILKTGQAGLTGEWFKKKKKRVGGAWTSLLTMAYSEGGGE